MEIGWTTIAIAIFALITIIIIAVLIRKFTLVGAGATGGFSLFG